jgi:hypothetical protein
MERGEAEAIYDAGREACVAAENVASQVRREEPSKGGELR